MPVTITLYESRFCGYCSAAKRLLERRGWPFEAINIDGRQDLFAEMEQRTGRNTVPQIFFGERHIGGFDDLAELDQLGELDRLYQ